MASLLSIGYSAPPQMLPSTPVLDFSLPRFGEDGYKIWDLKGSEGYYINAERVDVTDMILCIFSGDASGTVETCIESPKASIFINLSQARSLEPLKINNFSYTIEGKDWIWDGKQNKIIVHQDVHVVFNQQLRKTLMK